MISLEHSPSERLLGKDGDFFTKNLIRWYQKQDRQLPWRLMWAKHRDPWHIWVSEIMLQQTVIKAVIPVYLNFLRQYPSPEHLAKATTEDVRLSVRGLGYYRRFDALHKACRELSEQSRPMPTSFDEWIKLPGIGPYTAAAIASITQNEPHGVVDGNVERVMCRLLDLRLPPNTPALKKMFKSVMDFWCRQSIPGHLNQAVMELGQTLCTPTSPSCAQCPLQSKCQSFANASQSLSPAPKVKKIQKDENLSLIIYTHKGKIGLVRRTASEKFLKETLGFQTLYSTPKVPAEPIATITHSITHHKISAAVITTECDLPSASDKNFIWLLPQDIEKNLVSNLDRKAWTAFLKSRTLQVQNHASKKSRSL